MVTREASVIGRWTVLAALAIGLAGCSKPRQNGADNQLAPATTAQQRILETGTSSLLTHTYVTIVSVSGDAAAATTDRQIQEDSLRWRINAINRLDVIRAIDDPRLQFVTLWAYIEQLKRSLTKGFGEDRFGPVQGMYVKATDDLDQRVQTLAYQVFPANVVDAAKPEIQKLATDPKVTEEPNQVMVAANSTLSGILYIPMAPVSGLRGVGDTPAAINRFTDQATDIGKMIERLPERTRWQMELFLLEAEESGAVARSIKDFEAMIAEVREARAEVSKIATTVQQVPERAQAMLQDVLKHQPEVAKDLERVESSMKLAKETVIAADPVVARVDTAMTNARTTMDDARKLLGDVDKSAQMVQSAAVEIRGLVADFDKPSKTPPTTQPAEDSVTPAKIQQMAAEVRASAVELRGLLSQLREPTPLAGIDQTAARLEQLLWKALAGVAALMVLAFGLAVAYRRTGRAK